MQNSYKFKITILQQLKMLWYTISITALFFIVGRFFLHYKLTGTSFLIGFSFLFLFGILPVIIIHVQYLIKNWDGELFINVNERTLSYKSNGINLSTDFGSIESLHHYASYGGGTGWYTFSEYRYYKILLKNKKEIIVTCLMVNKIKEVFEEILPLKPEKHLRVIALIY